MGLADEIFPVERRERFVQTEWAEGWALTAVGFQEAARLLTEASRKIGASLDQVGLVVFFLQRHRMELAMKELLDGAGVEIKDITTHSLTKLWGLCRDAVGKATGAPPNAWAEIDAVGGELVALIDKHDPGSFSFRYPVDRDGEPNERPQFINLDPLEKHVGEFVSILDGFQTFIAETQAEIQDWGD
jgi:hypothetical protein